MRLAPTPFDLPDLERTVAEVLDQRLRPAATHPVAVAVSGGGDSLALLLAAAAWARATHRRLLVLTVDHGLNPASGAWTATCAAHAARLGAGFVPLSWEGPKPTTGLAATARTARHVLLAQAARAAGARVILIGHTADDVLEARAMRSAGSSTPEPRVWSPSPVWPEGRGLFLLRPLLGLRRSDLRRWLEARGETWIDDPANADPRFARTRARGEMDPAAAAPEPAEPVQPRALAAACRMDAAGVLTVARDSLRSAPQAEATAFLGAACLCAAGTTRPPSPPRLRNLLARLRSDAAVAATLAGARIEGDAGEVRILREAGEAARGGLGALSLDGGQTAVWDGRFEITADADLEVRPLAGLAARLPGHERKALLAFPAKARPGLPATVRGGRAACLVLGGQARALALERLHAACGLVEGEPA